MEFYISVKDLGLILLFLAGITALIILSVTLFRINSLVGRFTKLLETNKTNIDKTLQQIPDTVTNANLALDEVRSTAKTTTAFIDGLGDTVSESAASLEETYGQYVEVIKSIIGIFMKIKEILK